VPAGMIRPRTLPARSCTRRASPSRRATHRRRIRPRRSRRRSRRSRLPRRRRNPRRRPRPRRHRSRLRLRLRHARRNPRRNRRPRPRPRPRRRRRRRPRRLANPRTSRSWRGCTRTRSARILAPTGTPTRGFWCSASSLRRTAGTAGAPSDGQLGFGSAGSAIEKASGRYRDISGQSPEWNRHRSKSGGTRTLTYPAFRHRETSTPIVFRLFSWRACEQQDAPEG
jgi:hypothetical protein